MLIEMYPPEVWRVSGNEEIVPVNGRQILTIDVVKTSMILTEREPNRRQSVFQNGSQCIIDVDRIENDLMPRLFAPKPRIYLEKASEQQFVPPGQPIWFNPYFAPDEAMIPEVLIISEKIAPNGRIEMYFGYPLEAPLI